MKIRIAVLVVILLIIGGAIWITQSKSGPVDIGGGPGMLFFYVDWCHVCQSVKPIVSGLEDKYGNDFKIIRLNVETKEGRDAARKHGILGQPTILLFDRSGKEVRRLMGFQTSQTLEREIDRILGK